MKRPSSIIRTARRHRTAKEIAGILRNHRRSGLSLLAFARKEGLCYESLLRWRSRPRQRAKALVSGELGVDPRFVPVTIEGEVLGGEYVLNWAGGCSLKIPLQFETDSLRRLLTLLEGWR